MASSSSPSSLSITRQPIYDVFLNFRGEDTRDNFTSHLSGALHRKGLVFFIDDCGLKKGDEISPTLLRAIEQSKISVLVFSKDYASSRWCLDELVKILECKKKNGQMVIPVFYHVDPSDVRHQTGSFKATFVKHEQRYKNMTEKVHNWRTALTEVANLCGFSSSSENWPENKLVENIVNDILKKLHKMPPLCSYEGLVGMNSRFEEIKSLLCLDPFDSQIVGIWGMGGIGKTTLAEVVFQQLSHKFEGCCFIEKFSEKAKQSDGLPLLHRQLMSKVFGEGNLNIDASNLMDPLDKSRLQHVRVFIVFDDVNEVEYLKKLIGGLYKLGKGSRVIITTRDKQVLENFDAEIYKVEGLENYEALQLFSNHAFKLNHPSEDFLNLSRNVVDYADGNPLALKVLGASLYKKTIQFWESALKKLKKVPNCKIYDVLKVSYDGLDDHEVKNMFLDIAIFFKGENKGHVTNIMDDWYISAHSGLEVLVEKSLITILNDSNIEIHDLLQEMGKEIAHEESPKPGKCSRLCNPNEIYRILKDNTGTDAKGLILDMSEIPTLCLSPQAFVNMHNLQFLKFYESQSWRDFADTSTVYLSQGLSYLPNRLKYLYWARYPLKKLPTKFSLKNLVVLKLPNNNLKELWVRKEHAPKLRLKSIDLQHSSCLTCIPDLSNFKELEDINFSFCKSLGDIASSIQCLDSLRILNLSQCESLKSFSSHVHFKCLDELLLWGCKNLSEFPNVSGSIKCIDLSRTTIKKVPSSIGCIENLAHLLLADCENLRSFSSNIHFRSPIQIYLSGCTNLLNGPVNLVLSDCVNLGNIPRSINNCQNGLKQIHALNLAYCNLTEMPEYLYFLSSLEYLDLSGNDFMSVPASIKQLSWLKFLFLNNCHWLRSLGEFPLCLWHLEVMNCEELQSLPVFQLSDFKEVDASKLQIESYSGGADRKKVNEFLFTNCPKLNGNASIQFLADAPLRFQSMVATSLEYRHQDMMWDAMPAIEFCLPGSEIPDWVSYQSLGSSFSVDLSQDCFNENFIGFALCAVIQLEKGYDFTLLKIISEYNFETKYGDRIEFNFELTVFPWDSDELIERDHVVIMYDPCFNAKLRKGEHTAASFEFRPLAWYWKDKLVKGYKVKSCGAHPLYS